MISAEILPSLPKSIIKDANEVCEWFGRNSIAVNIAKDLAIANTLYSSQKRLSSLQIKAAEILLSKKFGSVEFLPESFPWAIKIKVKLSDVRIHRIGKNPFTNYGWACDCKSWLNHCGCQTLDRIQPSLDTLFG